MRRLAESPGTGGGVYTGAGRPLWVIAKCTSATAGAVSGVGLQCFPATLVDPRGEVAAADQPTGGDVWLTVLDGTTAATPESGKNYVGLLLGNITVGGSTRPRMVAAAPIPKRFGFYARITGFTGGTAGTAPYSWQEIKVSGTTWSDVSGSTGTLNAVPIPTDGTTPPVGVGARVWMWESLTSGRYEFIPWQYAGVTGGTVPVPGLISTTTQVMGDGRKEFASDLRVYQSAVHSASDARAAITVSGTGGATNGATVTLFTDAGHTGVFGVNHNSGDPYTQVGASGGAGFQFRLSVASLYGHLTATGDISAGGSVLADADGVFYHGANVGQTYTALLKDRFGADLGLVFSGGILVGVI